VNILIWLDVTGFLIFAAFTVMRAPRTPWFFAGLVLAAIASPLWMLARWQLGKSFVVRAEAHQLVTKGLYSKFRNPIYLFGGLAFLGLLVAWKNLFIVLFFLGFNAVQILRVRKEEAVLEKAFGDEYRQYKARTWF
jgi:protein-S-isoprenylcysteine O-methyltransferase Ste14